MSANRLFDTDHTGARVDNVLAAIESSSGSVDEHAFTPMRFITVFFPEFFSGPFLANHGDVAGILLAVILSIVAFRDRMSELEEKELEGNRGRDFIISRLRTDKEKKQESLNLGLDLEIKPEVLEGLQEVANELFPGSSLEINSNKDPKKPYFSLVLADEKLEEKTLFSKLPEWMKNLINKNERLIHTIDTIAKNAWRFLSTYSLYYWLVYFFAVYLISATLSVPLALGLAAAIPAAYLVFKLGLYVKNKMEKPKVKFFSEEIENELIIIKACMEKLAREDKLNKKLAEEEREEEVKLDLDHSSSDEGPEESLKEESEEENLLGKENTEKEKQAKEIFKKLFGQKKLLILTSVISALIGGYIIATFIQWPLTDLFVAGLHLAAPGIGVAFGVALGIGILYSLIEGIRKHEKIEKSKAIAVDFLSKNNDFLELKNNFEEKIKDLETLLARPEYKNNSNLRSKRALYLKHIKRMRRDLLHHKDNLPETFRRRLAMFITGAGSGIFVARTLLLAGCIVPFYLGALSWGLSLGITVGMGVIWGLFKVVSMIQAKEEARELGMIKKLPYFSWAYKNNIELLDGMEENIKEDLRKDRENIPIKEKEQEKVVQLTFLKRSKQRVKLEGEMGFGKKTPRPPSTPKPRSIQRRRSIFDLHREPKKDK